MISARALAALLTPVLVAATVLSLSPSSTPSGRAVIELQTGPLTLALGDPEQPVAIIAARHCLQRGCPVFAIRTLAGGSRSAQGAPAETGRVQRLQPRALQRERLLHQAADQRLGEQGRMSEAACAEPGECVKSVGLLTGPI